jgi:hypothetical protein
MQAIAANINHLPKWWILLFIFRFRGGLVSEPASAQQDNDDDYNADYPNCSTPDGFQLILRFFDLAIRFRLRLFEKVGTYDAA